MGMTIKYGGRMLVSFPVPAGYGVSEIWEEGEVLTVGSAGTLQTVSNNTKGILGLALNYRRSALDDQSVGIEGVKKQSIICDTAIIETTTWASGTTMASGERLYCNAAGDIDNHDPSGASRPVGVVISVTASGVQGASTMTALWNPLQFIV